MLILGTREYAYVTLLKDFADVIKTVALNIEKVACVIQMGPIESHEPLKTELSPAEAERRQGKSPCQKDSTPLWLWDR